MYLAFLYSSNPGAIPNVDWFKEQMANSMRLVAVSIYFEINVKLQTRVFHEDVEEAIQEFKNIGGSLPTLQNQQIN